MGKNVVVSVITPSYNQAEFIEETIMSVQNQTYPFVEHVIVDGASTDGTVDILRKYDGKVVCVSEPDNGETEAMNKGIKMAKGELIAFVSSDNTLEPDSVERVVSFFNNHPEVEMVSGGSKTIDKNGKVLEVIYPPEVFSVERLIRKLGSYGMAEPATFIKKGVLEDVGGFDEKLNYVNEVDLFIRIGQKYTVGHIQHILASVRQQPESISLRKSREVRAEFRMLSRKYLNPTIWNYVIIAYLDLKRFIYHSTRQSYSYSLLQQLRQKIRRKHV